MVLFQAIRLTKFDYRLASELEEGFQKLRCRVNYQSLRFTTAIANMGKNIVKRLKTKGGRYIALHLRSSKLTLCRDFDHPVIIYYVDSLLIVSTFK